MARRKIKLKTKIRTGEKVFVYRNLHKKCWSVRSVKTGLVIYHTKLLLLRDCSFKVSQAGRARVIKEKKKNVHAGVIGTTCGIPAGPSEQGHLLDLVDMRQVVYFPYKHDSFIDKSNEVPIRAATYILLCDDGGVYAFGGVYGVGA